MGAHAAATAALLALAGVAGCTSNHGQQQLPEDPQLRHVATVYGAEYTGAKFIVAYARDPDGQPLRGCGADFCRAEHGIRMVIFATPLRSPESHGVPVREQPPFTWFATQDGAVSRFGFARYRPDTQHDVWIQRVMAPPLNSMQAELSLASGRSVRYSYVAASETDHTRTYHAVARYLQTVGLSHGDVR